MIILFSLRKINNKRFNGTFFFQKNFIISLRSVALTSGSSRVKTSSVPDRLRARLRLGNRCLGPVGFFLLIWRGKTRWRRIKLGKFIRLSRESKDILYWFKESKWHRWQKFFGYNEKINRSKKRKDQRTESQLVRIMVWFGSKCGVKYF